METLFPMSAIHIKQHGAKTRLAVGLQKPGLSLIVDDTS